MGSRARSRGPRSHAGSSYAAVAVLGLGSAPGPASGAEPRSLSAAQVLAASRRMTSMEADPCREPAAGDEIVVCGRVTERYDVPLYSVDAEAGRRDGRGSAAGGLVSAREAVASCHARGEACVAPLPVIGVSFGKGKKDGVRVGKD